MNKDDINKIKDALSKEKDLNKIRDAKNKIRDFKRCINSEFEDFDGILEVLQNDTERLIDISNIKTNELINGPESIFLKEQKTWFRLVIRLIFTAIDSSCFKMKNIALNICDFFEKPLSSKERELLSERKTKDGRLFYVSTDENIKLAFNKLSYALGINYKINFGKEWTILLRLLKKRHDLTHPKNKSDLEVSLADYNDANVVCEWFNNTLGDIISRYLKY
jgi:hypothetical protein